MYLLLALFLSFIDIELNMQTLSKLPYVTNGLKLDPTSHFSEEIISAGR